MSQAIGSTAVQFIAPPTKGDKKPLVTYHAPLELEPAHRARLASMGVALGESSDVGASGTTMILPRGWSITKEKGGKTNIRDGHGTLLGTVTDDHSKLNHKPSFAFNPNY